MANSLDPAEQALLQHALARGLLSQSQADEALALRAASAARGIPLPLLGILRDRYLSPASLAELAASSGIPLSSAEDADAESATVLADVPPPQPPPADARRIGPYEVVSEIARGGMGVVYVARRAGQQEKLALKLLLNSERAEPKDVQRFKIEAAAAGKLSHPNIVKIRDVGQDARGCHFMVMDFVEGDSLQGLLKRQGPMDPREAARVGIKLARALQHAHDQRVLHRDMKPANVLVREGEPLIADFGLAKEQGAGGKSLTLTGEIMGTPAYMPPEQAEGARKEIDARSDQYSLGATLYQVLTGLPPFQGQSPINVVMAVLTKPPAPLRKRRPEVDPALEAIVLRTLSKERDERYPDCEALAQALEGWLGPGEAEGRRKGGRVALVALALLALGAVAAFATRATPESATAASAVATPSAKSRPRDPARSTPAPPAESAPPDSAPTPAESPSPSLPDPVAAYTPPPLVALFDESGLERVVRLDATSLGDSTLEHLELGQPWLITQTPEGLLFRGNRNASPRLKLPLKSAGGANRPFMLRLKFRVTHLGRELHFGVGLSSQDRASPRLAAVAMATKATDRPNFCGIRARYHPVAPLFRGKRLELFSPQLKGFRPAQELTIEVRASEHKLELTTLVGERVLDRSKTNRASFDRFQLGALDLEVGFLQSNTVHERRKKGFSRQLNRGEALLISCELLAEPGTFTLTPAERGPWRLLGLAGRALARGDLARAAELLSDRLLSPEALSDDRAYVRAGLLRALIALPEHPAQAIQELRLLDAREQERFPRVGTRAADKERFAHGLSSSFWGLRAADLPLVDAKLRGLFADAYRAQILHSETDLSGYAAAQRLFFELDAEALPDLSAAYRALRARNGAPLAGLVRARVAKTLRREESWRLRQHLCSWLALNLSLAEPPAGSSDDTVAGYLWSRAGAQGLAWQLLQPSLKSETPFERWIAVNFGANAFYRRGDYARALELWQGIEAEALEGPLSLSEGGVDAGVHQGMSAPFEHARRMVESR